MTLFLTEADVEALVSPPESIACLERALTLWGTLQGQSSPRQRLMLEGGSYNVMSAVGARYFGAKSYFAAPFGRGYHVLLYNIDDARLVAVIEAQSLSRARTGAATGVATKLLARPSSGVLGQIGTGRQALEQIRSVLAVRSLKQIRLFGRSRERANALAAEITRQTDLDIKVCDTARDCVDQADIVTTITTAAAPVLSGDWLAPGTHVNLVGANSAARREADDRVIERAGLVVTDDSAQARKEAAELIGASEEAWKRVVDLGSLLARNETRSPNEITVFKSLGIALEDIALAATVFENAMRLDRGSMIGA